LPNFFVRFSVSIKEPPAISSQSVADYLKRALKTQGERQSGVTDLLQRLISGQGSALEIYGFIGKDERKPRHFSTTQKSNRDSNNHSKLEAWQTQLRLCLKCIDLLERWE
jgi:hypothetical protein